VEKIMSESYADYQQRLEIEALQAMASTEPWRVQRGTIGYDVVAVVDNEVVSIASCHTREMAQYLCGLHNSGRAAQ
jgi:hypothetical protein